MVELIFQAQFPKNNIRFRIVKVLVLSIYIAAL